jgi:methyl coenzyme M reductase subunit C
MLAQGGAIDDRWALAIGEDGMAHKLAIAPTGRIVTCPHCNKPFSLEGAQE